MGMVWSGCGVDGAPGLEAWALEEALLAWETRPEGQRDPVRNRQLLAQLAIHLVQGFRAEEARLLRDRAPEMSRRRLENRRLALRLCELMSDAECGLDITEGLRLLLSLWRGREVPPRCLATGTTAAH
jgi:hypothetical protein